MFLYFYIFIFLYFYIFYFLYSHVSILFYLFLFLFFYFCTFCTFRMLSTFVWMFKFKFGFQDCIILVLDSIIPQGVLSHIFVITRRQLHDKVDYIFPKRKLILIGTLRSVKDNMYDQQQYSWMKFNFWKNKIRMRNDSACGTIESSTGTVTIAGLNSNHSRCTDQFGFQSCWSVYHEWLVQ